MDPSGEKLGPSYLNHGSPTNFRLFDPSASITKIESSGRPLGALPKTMEPPSGDQDGSNAFADPKEVS